jgi:TrmH family RNA methyltransferase
MEASAELRYLVVEAGAEERITELHPMSAVPVFAVAPPVFKTLAATQSPQGVLGVAKVPESRLGVISERLERTPGRVLILDGIQDPGNVGTLLRSAVAMGAIGAIALDGTADPWSPKAIRAAAGESFKIPVVQAPWAEIARWCGEVGLEIWVASAEGRDVRSLTMPSAHGRPLGLVLGNEGQGPRAEVREAATVLVSIPLLSGVESLNVAQAGTLLLWALGPAQDPPAATG